MSAERWHDSGEEGMWKPWNGNTDPGFTIASIWDKSLPLLITFALWFTYGSQHYIFFFPNLDLIQKINFLVFLDSNECQ